MILQQNALLAESLWVEKPINQFNLTSIKRHWNITVKSFGHLHRIEDDLGRSYQFRESIEGEEEGEEEEEEGDEEMPDVDEETDPSGTQILRRRVRRKHREISADVADFVNQRQLPTYHNWTCGQQAVYDNISAGIGETREYHATRKEWEDAQGAYQQEQWANITKITNRTHDAIARR
ncbi:hypothetical protein Hanom_Chr12g01065671 [Helianthus anomalus]